jgi:hypothetical protein
LVAYDALGRPKCKREETIEMKLRKCFRRTWIGLIWLRRIDWEQPLLKLPILGHAMIISPFDTVHLPAK